MAALGILSRATGALGYTSNIPAECWNQTGFKDCHAKSYAEAQASCAKQNMPNDTGCIDPTTDSITMQKCKCTKAGTKPAPKPVIISSSTTPKPGESLEPAQANIMGMDMKTVFLVGLVGVGLYMFMSEKKGKP